MDDLLGFDRYDQHTRWRAGGRVLGEVDEIEPRDFTIERRDSAWLLTAGGRLVVVGDSGRDLVAENGHLRRQPAKHGFLPYLSASLLLQINVVQRAELRTWALIGEPRSARHADRPATDLDLSHLAYAITLGIDSESGVWTYLQTEGFTVTVDELTLEAPASPMFELLAQVPDIDLSQRVPVTHAAATALRRVQDASGLTVEVMAYDDQTDEFQLVLLNADGEPQGLVSRQHDWSQVPAVFGGIQHRTESADWVQHIDTTSHDPLWVRRIVEALDRV